MADRTRIALRQMAKEEPELAARLVLQTLPAAAQRISPPLAYDMTVEGMGTWHVAVTEQGAEVTQGANGRADFELVADPAGLAQMALGASALRLMLGGHVKIKGKRRRALKLRAMSNGSDPSMAEAVAAGAKVDADAIYRALPYLIDPEWTRGHSFTVGYEIAGEGGGRWFVQVRDGQPLVVTTEPPEGGADGTTRVSAETFRGLVSGKITPPEAMSQQLTDIEGEIYPVTLLGRWMDRSQGRDDEELRREQHQRAVQASRAGTWGGVSTNGKPLPAGRPVAEGGQGDPGHDAAGDARRGDLMSYEQLYALWERQNWKAHEIDFSVDREQWVATPREAQLHSTWSLGSFYVGEERVTADLAPFVMAAPNGEVEIFLSTQLVDEARHAAFFDRFGAEVMALDSDDLRGRLRDLEEQMLGEPWHNVFDGGLRDIARRVQAEPDNLDLFVEGITTYHLIIEGVLAMTGQRFILKYMEDHGLYPGFQKGFSLVEQDEHRHIAFGIRFLKDVMDDDPQRFGPIIQGRVEELVPKALHVFVPPYADDPREFVSYGYHSSHVYGFAYRKLKRRMSVLGLEIPPAEELLPGPMASPEEARAAGAPV